MMEFKRASLIINWNDFNCVVDAYKKRFWKQLFFSCIIKAFFGTILYTTWWNRQESFLNKQKNSKHKQERK